MVLILEGPNKCGKTTLAKFLVKEYNFAYFKDYTVDDKLDTSFDPRRIEYEICAQARLLNSLAEYKLNIVVDRFHISEFVYGLCRRGYTSRAIGIAENVLRSDNVKLLLLTDEDEKINERVGKNEIDVINSYADGFIQSKLNKTIISNIFSKNSKIIVSSFLKLDLTKLKISKMEKEFV